MVSPIDPYTDLHFDPYNDDPIYFPNLSNLSFLNANLSYTNLSGVNLSRANLSNADLSNANLLNTNLSEVDLSRTKLSNTILSGQNFNIRIIEEPLTARTLTKAVSAINKLYTKIWLIQQGRFEDCIQYDQDQNPTFEEQSNLIITKLSYNSPADIKFNVDFSIKGLAESFVMLLKLKNLKKELESDNQSKELDNKNKELDNQKKAIEVLESQVALIINTAEKLNNKNIDEETKKLVIQTLASSVEEVNQLKALHIASTPAPLLISASEPPISTAANSTSVELNINPGVNSSHEN